MAGACARLENQRRQAGRRLERTCRWRSHIRWRGQRIAGFVAVNTPNRTKTGACRRLQSRLYQEQRETRWSHEVGSCSRGLPSSAICHFVSRCATRCRIGRTRIAYGQPVIGKPSVRPRADRIRLQRPHAPARPAPSRRSGRDHAGRGERADDGEADEVRGRQGIRDRDRPSRSARQRDPPRLQPGPVAADPVRGRVRPVFAAC